MKHDSLPEAYLVGRLASIESALNQLQADFQATTWRKSSIVENCITLAKTEINASIQKFVENKNEESARMANLAWLHVEFGRSLIDAETTEGLLGEGNFLELSSTCTTSSLLVKYFRSMETKIIRLRSTIKEALDGKQK
jgi:hypothetical protein